MSLYDDMMDLEEHFKDLKKSAITSSEKLKARELCKAYDSLTRVFAAMEHKEIESDKVMLALSTIFAVFEVNRGYEEN
jgi:hypothetical protein